MSMDISFNSSSPSFGESTRKQSTTAEVPKPKTVERRTRIGSKAVRDVLITEFHPETPEQKKQVRRFIDRVIPELPSLKAPRFVFKDFVRDVNAEVRKAHIGKKLPQNGHPDPGLNGGRSKLRNRLKELFPPKKTKEDVSSPASQPSESSPAGRSTPTVTDKGNPTIALKTPPIPEPHNPKLFTTGQQPGVATDPKLAETGIFTPEVPVDPRLAQTRIYTPEVPVDPRLAQTGIFTGDPNVTRDFTPAANSDAYAKTGVMPTTGATDSGEFSFDAVPVPKQLPTPSPAAETKSVKGEPTVRVSMWSKAKTWITGGPKTAWDKKMALPKNDLASTFGAVQPLPGKIGVQNVVNAAEKVTPKRYQSPIALTSTEAAILKDYYDSPIGLEGSFGYMVNTAIQNGMAGETVQSRFDKAKSKARPVLETAQAAQLTQPRSKRMPDAYAQSLAFNATFGNAIELFVATKALSRFKTRLDERKQLEAAGINQPNGSRYMILAESLADVLSGNPYRTNAWIHGDANTVQESFIKAHQIKTKAEKRALAHKDLNDTAGEKLERDRAERNSDEVVTKRLLTRGLKQSNTWESPGHGALAEEVVNHLARLYPEQKFLTTAREQAVALVKENLMALELGLATNVIDSKRQMGSARNASDRLTKAQHEIMSELRNRPKIVERVSEAEQMVKPTLERLKKGEITEDQALKEIREPFGEKLTQLYGDVMSAPDSIREVEWRLAKMKEEARKTPIQKLAAAMLSGDPITDATSLKTFKTNIDLLKKMNGTSTISLDPRSDQTQWDASGLTQPIKSAWWWTKVKRFSLQGLAAMGLFAGTTGGVVGYNNIREQARVAEARKVEAEKLESAKVAELKRSEVDKKAKALALKKQEEDKHQELISKIKTLSPKTEPLLEDFISLCQRKQNGAPLKNFAHVKYNGQEYIKQGRIAETFYVPLVSDLPNKVYVLNTYLKPGEPGYPSDDKDVSKVYLVRSYNVDSKSGEVTSSGSGITISYSDGTSKKTTPIPHNITNEERQLILDRIKGFNDQLSSDMQNENY